MAHAHKIRAKTWGTRKGNVPREPMLGPLPTQHRATMPRPASKRGYHGSPGKNVPGPGFIPTVLDRTVG